MVLVLLVITSLQASLLPLKIEGKLFSNFSWGEEVLPGKQKGSIASMSDVKLHIQDDQVVVVDNGILQLTFTVPEGALIGIQYNGIDNLLELHNPELNGGLNGTSFEVVTENEEQVELSFKRTWDTSLQGEHAPLYIDKRFIMLRGSSGFYSYAIYEHLEDMPSFVLYETRIAFMLKIDKFRYMAIADNRQRHMPLPDDRLPGRGEELAYPEAVRLVDPIEPEFRGEVDDKYQYSCENKDNQVHGWICFDPPVGFWQISPTNEFRTGGPVKQDLTSHVNPTTLAMFVSAHYGGVELSLQFKSGEPWKKVFGPVFIYLNSVSDGGKALSLWDDAKEQMKVETQGWPYSFPNSEDFPNSDQRGTVTGRLLVQDRFRQYGLWERYADLYPDGDLVYTVGVSDYQRDWFFAHVSRKTGDDTYEATTWQINFHLKNVYESGAYKLRLALASATHSVLEVRINDPQANRPQFSSGLIGTDNAIARHGIHGLYYLFNVDIPYDQLVEGDNTIFLTQTSSTSPFHGIMYDYIRLEGPPSPNS
ncbi:rhamnogalacturonate lyase family protein [Actinidia rufa]|uniref:Rhamnogalacturonate lyase family protein n=1 Tax=Actinidia rufa TaxID=165716 RepID=A0A7J0FBK5_9ERIC|nr:rhamnogalacturonate lyase family protein [Actinidia rufa]